MMPATHWERVKELFEGAVALAPDQRAAFLDKACGGDLTLRREVESLIECDHEAEHLLALPALARQAEPEAEQGSELAAGFRVGAYRVVGLIGRGGMGEVYCAVRDDEHFDKMVAVKLVRRGQDRDTTVRRFRAERQILARLEHPGIARLLDGGATEDGRPYFVMEHVAGMPIDSYADARGLGVRERLELFRAVCAAVQYAHQNLVVHRDIKPANILITPTGQPKLLDFGIAKLLDPGSPDATATAISLMTPAYASPEQILGDPITTATDVYSLGVVLYELLTGRRPYNVASANPIELQRLICVQEPEKPSTVARRAAETQPVESSSETLPINAQRPRRRRLLHADLDAIVLKALRKEPDRRYHSAEQLSEDIDRHLRGRPVHAHKDTFSYRWGKFLRRHRLGVASAAVVLLSLVAGLVGTAWQARVALAERRRTEQERARAERRFADVRKLANALLFDLEEAIRELPGSTPARQLMVNKALEYLDGLSGEAGADAALQNELATAYEKVGRVQGYGSGANLGDTAGAFESFRKALAIRNAIVAQRPDDARALSDLAASHRYLANLYAKKGDVSAAAESYRQAAAAAEKMAQQDPADASHHMLLARSSVGLGRELAAAGRLDAALEAYRRGLRAAEEGHRLAPAQARAALALAHQGLGDGLQSAGQPAPALEHAEKALALFRATAQESPASTSAVREVALARLNVADTLLRLGRQREALVHAREALTVFERLFAADPSNALAERDVWAALYRIGTGAPGALGPGEPVEACRRAVEIARRVQKRDPASHWALRDLAASHRALGEALTRAGRHEEALRSQRESLEQARGLTRGRDASPRDRQEVARALAAMGTSQLAAGEPSAAQASLQEASAILEALSASDAANAELRAERAQAVGRLAEAQKALGRK